MAAPKPIARLGLVGSGAHLTRVLEAFRGIPDIAVEVVADVSGTSQGAQFARSLGIPTVATPMDVFRSSADLILEVNGEDRVYERLLAVKPPRVEVMSARGVRLLLEFLSRGGEARDPTAAHAVLVVAADQVDLYESLARGFTGVSGIEVVLDRRRTDRRQRVRAAAVERRKTERRRSATVDRELQVRGFAVARRRSSSAGA
jgi:hypothetical protein